MKQTLKQSASERITKAKIAIILDVKLAFFASLMMKKPFIADASVQTACTDGKCIRYNPQFFDELSNEEIKFVIVHEVMHITNLHHTRRSGRDAALWNEAADYCINWMLKEAGMHLPKGVLIDAKFANMSAESVYSILSQQKQQQQPQPQEDDQQEQDDDDQQGDQLSDSKQQNDDGDSDDQSQDANTDDSEGDNSDGEGDGSEDGEDGKDGQQNDSDGDSDGEGDGEGDKDGNNNAETFGIGGVVDAPATKMAEMEQAEAEAKQEIAAAIQIAKSKGSLSPFLEKMAREMLEPKVAWQEVLSRFLTDTSKDDYSFMRPSRKSLGRLSMPSLYKQEVGKVVLVLDTSISVFSQIKLLNRFIAEMQDVCSMMHSPITVLHVDTEVRGEPDIIEPDDTFAIKPRGGGGTDFRPAFEWLEENDEEVAALIYFTDMECYSYPPEPSYPVLWARYGSDRSVPPFGEIIQVDGFREGEF